MTILNTGKNEYILRLTTRNVVDIEERLGGKNILYVFDNELPATKDLMIVLHGSLVSLNHGITLNDVYDIYDDFLANGGSLAKLLEILLAAMREGGIIPKEDEEDSKN